MALFEVAFNVSKLAVLLAERLVGLGHFGGIVCVLLEDQVSKIRELAWVRHHELEAIARRRKILLLWAAWVSWMSRMM